MTTTHRQKTNALELVKLVCRALDDKKAENIQVLDVSAQSSITDYFVIATGTSEPHLRALRVELEKTLDAVKAHILGMDTQQGSGWLVVDAFDVMVHLFTAETRGRYSLENLWKDAVEISVPRLLAPPAKDEPAPKRRPAAARKAKPAKAAKATKGTAPARKPAARPKVKAAKKAPARKSARVKKT